MAWRMEHLQRAQGVVVVERLVNRARVVPRAVEAQSELKRDQFQGLLGQQGHRLGATVATDDIGLPRVRADGRSRSRVTKHLSANTARTSFCSGTPARAVAWTRRGIG